MSTVSGDRHDVEALLDLMDEMGRLMKAGRAHASWMQSDLTLGQIRFIFALGEEGPLSVGQVAGHLGVTLTTASQFIDRLETAGYVERSHRSDDRRVVECRVTIAGRDLIAAMRGMQREGLSHIMGLLEPDEVRDMERVLRVVVERLRASAASTDQRQYEQSTR
jgi:DNA-binding MarR family transcriptional regulator